MVEDSRYRTLAWLNAYIVSANMTRDNAVTPLTKTVFYSDPDYELLELFSTKGFDVAFAVGNPTSRSLLDWDQTTYGYQETVPIIIYCIDKDGITGIKTKQKAEMELRRIFETYYHPNHRSFSTTRSLDKNMGSFTLYGTEYSLTYVRDET